VLTMATIFALGVLATNAEPALNVLGATVETLSNGQFSKRLLVWAVSIGVAIGMDVGAAKILFSLPLIYFILGKYAVASALTAITKEGYAAVAWDSAGVTTGPVTGKLMTVCCMVGVCGLRAPEYSTVGALCRTPAHMQTCAQCPARLQLYLSLVVHRFFVNAGGFDVTGEGSACQITMFVRCWVLVLQCRLCSPSALHLGRLWVHRRALACLQVRRLW
jgi:hypothetical protein